MKKSDIVKALALTASVSETEARMVIDGFMDLIVETAKRDGKLVINGFGSFEWRNRNERNGVDFKGQSIRIPASQTLGFVPSSNLRVKDAVATGK